METEMEILSRVLMEGAAPKPLLATATSQLLAEGRTGPQGEAPRSGSKEEAARKRMDPRSSID